jgi:hypothetical protein
MRERRKLFVGNNFASEEQGILFRKVILLVLVLPLDGRSLAPAATTASSPSEEFPMI